jgi:hypothetical protein
MNLLKQRGDLERERDILANLVEGECQELKQSSHIVG